MVLRENSAATRNVPSTPNDEDYVNDTVQWMYVVSRDV